MKHWAIISTVVFVAVVSGFLWWSNISSTLVTSPIENNVVATSTQEVFEVDSGADVSTTTETVEVTEIDINLAQSAKSVVRPGAPDLSVDSIKTKEDFKVVQDYIATLPSSDVSKMFYSGDISPELMDLLNIQLNFREIFDIAKPSSTILKDIDDYVTDERIKISDDVMGVNVSLLTEDNMEIYVYDSAGRYTGTYPLTSYSDEARGIFDEARGVDLMSFAESAIFNFTGPTESTLFFKGKKGIRFPNLHVGVINEEPFSKFFFPVTSSTRGSLVVTVDNNTITLGKLNIDFNDDGTTDVSLSITEDFSKDDYEKAFSLIENDTKLSDEDRAGITSWRKPFFEYVLKDDE